MKSVFKSIFLTVFIGLALYSTITSALYLLSNGFSFDDFGQFMTSVTIVTFFIGLYIVSQARTSESLSGFTIAILIGFLLGIGSATVALEYNVLGTAINMILVVGWIIYIKWYSVFDNRGTETLLVGKMLPRFELEDSNNKKVASKVFVGNPTIYLFHRGNWCPLCMAQIKEIAGQYKELEDRGVNMVFVSPQPHMYTKRLTKRYNLGFHYLKDNDNAVAKQLGILDKNGLPIGLQVLGFDSDTVMPTVIITDAKGKIVFVDLTDNYRVRPEPETFLKVIDEMK